MSSQIGLSFPAFICTSSIPDQNDLATQMVLQMLKCFNQLLTLHRTFKMTLVDLARHRQDYPCRYNPPISCCPLQDGPFAFPRPGRCHWFQKREAKFIKEHDYCAEPPTLFLSWTSLLPARLSPVFCLACSVLGGVDFNLLLCYEIPYAGIRSRTQNETA
jgi:hypothetical protein